MHCECDVECISPQGQIRKKNLSKPSALLGISGAFGITHPWRSLFLFLYCPFFLIIGTTICGMKQEPRFIMWRIWAFFFTLSFYHWIVMKSEVWVQRCQRDFLQLWNFSAFNFFLINYLYKVSFLRYCKFTLRESNGVLETHQTTITLEVPESMRLLTDHTFLAHAGKSLRLSIATTTVSCKSNYWL